MPQVHVPKDQDWARRIGWSPCSSRLLTATPGCVNLHDASAGGIQAIELTTIPTHSHACMFAWGPCGCPFSVWPHGTRQELAMFGGSAGGPLVSTARMATASRTRTAVGLLASLPACTLSAVDWSRAGVLAPAGAAKAAPSGGTIWLYCLGRGPRSLRLRVLHRLQPGRWLHSLSFSPCGALLACNDHSSAELVVDDQERAPGVGPVVPSHNLVCLADAASGSCPTWGSVGKSLAVASASAGPCLGGCGGVH